METIEIQTQTPLPIITIESGNEVHSWSCKCGRKLGPFSAQRSWEIHGEIICGECAQRNDPVYQEWLRDQVLMKELMWR